MFATIRTICLMGTCLLAGCASLTTATTAHRPPPPRGIVLVLDGAGGSPEAANAIYTAVEAEGIPLYVDTFRWTHGRNRTIADMTDIDHSRAMSQKFAGVIRKYRATHPNTPIVVVGYSAGAFVALESARYLDPDSLERIILLAPAVAADYDLRPALIASRKGVDVFSSERDRFFLGMGTNVVGTADGKTGVPAAGRVGFDPPCDPILARRLHPHPWDLSVAWSGNSGNHSGPLNPRFVNAYLLPLFDPKAP